MADRLPCPTCGADVDRLQPSFGAVAAYPCTCWLTPAGARSAVRQWREGRTDPTQSPDPIGG